MIPYNRNEHCIITSHPTLTRLRRELGRPHLKVCRYIKRGPKVYGLVSVWGHRLQEHARLSNWPMVSGAEMTVLRRMFNPDPRFEAAEVRELTKAARETREEKVKQGRSFREVFKHSRHFQKRRGRATQDLEIYKMGHIPDI